MHLVCSIGKTGVKALGKIIMFLVTWTHKGCINCAIKCYIILGVNQLSGGI